jgi:hypothetical protein
MADAPEEFNIASPSKLHARPQPALSDDCTSTWQSAGTLPVSGNDILVVDPMGYTPAEHNGQLLKWPFDAAEIKIKVIESATDDFKMITAVMVVPPNCDAMKFTTKEAGSIAVRSAHVVVADLDRIERNWKLSKDEMTWADAAELDDDYSDSLDTLQKSQLDSPVCTLDIGGTPFLICILSGWAHGVCWWDEMSCNGEIVGYKCRFLEDEAPILRSQTPQNISTEGRSVRWVVFTSMIFVAYLAWGFMAGSYAANTHSAGIIVGGGELGILTMLISAIYSFVATSIMETTNFFSIISWHFSNRIWLPILFILLEAGIALSGFALQKLEVNLSNPAGRGAK